MATTVAAKAAAPAFVDRASGRQPSRLRSLVAASVVGLAAAALTYRALRSTPSDDGQEERH